ncbi:MAG TPA: hypothetical protein DCS93_16410 [Microscillaceae bacterium]|nr:hypothetical protein [Microscillaceae bacterium]
MKYLVVVFYVGLLSTILVGCGDEPKNTTQQSKSSSTPATHPKSAISKLRQQSNNILGIWYLNEWDLYHTIRFIDKQKVEFYTHIDTILTYDYEMRPDSLLIFNEQGQRLYINLINDLTKDTLVFENLMEKAGSQHYSRKRIKKDSEKKSETIPED